MKTIKNSYKLYIHFVLFLHIFWLSLTTSITLCVCIHKNLHFLKFQTLDSFSRKFPEKTFFEFIDFFDKDTVYSRFMQPFTIIAD